MSNPASILRPSGASLPKPPSILDPGVTRIFALLAVAAGVGVGMAAGLGVSQNLLIGGVLSPFLLMFIYARPHWSVAVYAVLVYADLLSILVKYHDFPPLARFAGAVMLTAVLSYKLVYRRERLKQDALTRWLVAYGVVIALGLLYARNPDLVMPDVVEFIRNFLTYLVIVNGITTTARLKTTLGLVVAMGTLLALLSIYQSATGHTDSDFGGLAQFRVSEITGSTDAARPGGTIGDANYYGQNLLIVLPFALYFAFRAKSVLGRLGGAFAALALTGGIVFTYSRGDALALGALLLAGQVYKRPRPAILAAIVVAGLVAVPLLPSNYVARLSTVLGAAAGNRQAILNEDSLRGRAGAVQAAISMFADHPVLGVGRENYPLYQLQYLEGTSLAKYAKAIPPHDLYLEIATEEGLVGLVTVGGLLLVAFGALREAKRRFQVRFRGADAELAVWLGIGLFGYLVSSLFLHGAFLYMLWLQVAFIAALRQCSRTATLEPEVGAVLRGVTNAPSGGNPANEPSVPSYLVPVDISSKGLVSTLKPLIGKRKPRVAASRATPQPPAVAQSAPADAADVALSPADLFAAYWRAHGGPAIFGEAVGAVLEEPGTPESKAVTVQYYEHARFEYRPNDHAAQAGVALGKLGLEVPVLGMPASNIPEVLRGKPVHLRNGAAGPGVPPLFYKAWKQAGGVPVPGYAISPVLRYSSGGIGTYRQYFERACLQYTQDQNGATGVVERVPLGLQVYRARHGEGT